MLNRCPHHKQDNDRSAQVTFAASPEIRSAERPIEHGSLQSLTTVSCYVGKKFGLFSINKEVFWHRLFIQFKDGM